MVASYLHEWLVAGLAGCILGWFVSLRLLQWPIYGWAVASSIFFLSCFRYYNTSSDATIHPCQRGYYNRTSNAIPFKQETNKPTTHPSSVLYWWHALGKVNSKTKNGSIKLRKWFLQIWKRLGETLSRIANETDYNEG